MNSVETAAGNPAFSTLVSALSAAKVSSVDLGASNGVIQVIDTVMMPA